MKLICLLLTLLVLAASENDYKLYLMPTERGARCLDGSPTGLYFSEGKAPNNNKYMIYMNGGGFCAGFTLEQSLQACYIRSKKDIGTTKVAPAERNFQGYGLLSTDPQQNPVFHDWNKIYFIYCDGTQYTGSLNDPISYKDTKLYFRGYNNTLQQLRFVEQKWDIFNGDTIVLTGQSAGGMGTFFYSNYLMEHTKTAKVLAVPDSGIFLVDFYSEIAQTQIMLKAATPIMTLVNTQIPAFPIPQCIQANKANILQCYTTSNLTQYLKAPMLIVQSPYDSFSIKNIIYAHCATNPKAPYTLEHCNETTREVIEEYRKIVLQELKKMRGQRKDVGVWGPSCSQHCFTGTKTFTDGNFRVPSQDGKMVSEAIAQFLRDPENAPWYLDQIPWPYNHGCSGQSAALLRRQI